MKDKRVLYWKIMFTYIGAIIGAGFASGQEILRFFVKFGYWGAVGAMLAGLLLAYFGYSIITTAAGLSMASYEQYLLFLFGPKLSRIFDAIICVFLLAGLAVMLVSSGSLCHHLWGWAQETGFLLNAIFLYIVMLRGVSGMLWLNALLIPGLLILSLGVALEGIRGGEEIFFTQQLTSGFVVDSWLFAALLYVSYNLVLGMVVLVTLGETARQGGSRGVIAGGILLGIMAAFLSLALSMNRGIVQGHDIPMLALAESQNEWLSWGYSFVLWAAIVTTALGNGLGLQRRLEGIWHGPKPVLAVLPFLPTLFLLGWPLGRAVGIIYPLLGYLGLILFLAVLVKSKAGRKLFH